MNTILQILNTPQGQLWITSILLTIVGFFFVRTLVKIEGRMEKQDKRIEATTLILVKVLEKLGFEDEYFRDLSKQLTDTTK